MSTGRNDPCPCGSGKKYKQCCLGKGDPDARRRTKQYLLAALGVVAAAMICVVLVSKPVGAIVAGVGLGVLAVLLWLTAPPPASGGGADPSAVNFGR